MSTEEFKSTDSASEIPEEEYAYWHDWYLKQQSIYRQWAMYRDRYLCPCCFMPTLIKRADYEICPICFWEDDGQDTHNADVVKYGPNQDYSLAEARQNFRYYHTMLRPSDVVAYHSEEEVMDQKIALYKAYTLAIKTGEVPDWENALTEQRRYYGQS